MLIAARSTPRGRRGDDGRGDDGGTGGGGGGEGHDRSPAWPHRVCVAGVMEVPRGRTPALVRG